jgi:hypothetical protein
MRQPDIEQNEVIRSASCGGVTRLVKQAQGLLTIFGYERLLGYPQDYTIEQQLVEGIDGIITD